ncbi:uncharacterized protein EV422DRAFT_496796 [Fimicolochytrium jonesii]|uniref:uncharacterized protein n=1 Tax=Fimicolochytrium jonesii TaxID=1396493 RepID=UPI0022FDFAD6|nr:uncharacterized protein EV422DRAFT_496796 [Fimicolochytrium jonesii]KAI8820424.1 hypothetical protein EV422DRAFT_496796 [Fimicolochytrium jonesii]
MSHQDPTIERYGFTAVPRDPDVLFKDHPTASGPHPRQDPFELADFPIPETPLAKAVHEFVQKELDPPTVAHSHRVFFFGLALVRTHFPTWRLDAETYYLTSLLHDLGLAARFLSSTKLSFEFRGAIVARDAVLQLGGDGDVADAACEAIVRHQDVFVKGGNITTLGQVLQLATILDNVGTLTSLLHPSFISAVTTAYPRKGWGEHFARAIETELALKPWCHSTTFEVPGWREGMPSRFAGLVRGNEAMRAYE